MRESESHIDDEVKKAVEEANHEVKTRREMKSRQVRKTLWGEMRFYLGVDLPDDMPEENFKKYMAEYGTIIHNAFKEK